MLPRLLICAFTFLLWGCDGVSPSAGASAPGTTSKLKELQVEDVKEGHGPAAKKGDLLILQYTGKLKDGTVFDSNEGAERDPLTITLGEGSVIKGWDQGLEGAKKGGKRKLSIPASLAYGEQQTGKIPPNSDLYFEIDVLEMVPQAELPYFTKEDIKEGAGAEAADGRTVEVKYKSTLANGKVVEEQSEPLSFEVGDKTVFAWFEEAIKGMKSGGVRKVAFPPGSGPRYGELPRGVPAHTVVYYEIELISVK